MGNGVFSWVNHVDSSALSTPAQAATLPVTNLAEPIAGKVWRSLGSTNNYFDCDFGAAKPVQILALAGLNIGAADTVRHQLSAVSAGSAELYDSGAITGVNPNYDYLFTLLTAAVNARYWRCSINAASLAAQGYFDVGRAWAGPIWQPASNFSYGWGETWADDSRVTSSQKSGADYIDHGPRRRIIDVSFARFSAADQAQAKELDRVAGINGQVLFIPNPDSANRNTEGLIGRMTSVTPILQPNFSIYSKNYSIRQSL